MNAAHRIVRIASAWPPHSDTGCETEWIFCPWLRGLPRRFSLSVASLPIHDANAVLLDALAKAEFLSAALRPTFAGVCLVDPFRQMEKLFQTLAGVGVSGVINLPTTGAFGGSMARALDDLGTGTDREIAMLAVARAQGLRIAGAAAIPATAARMVGIGCEFVLLLNESPESAGTIMPGPAQVAGSRYASTFNIEED